MNANSGVTPQLDSSRESSRRWTLAEAVEYLTLRLDQGHEAQFEFSAIRPLELDQWTELDSKVSSSLPPGRRRRRALDAERMLWLRGLLALRPPIDERRARALGNALSVGLRTNAYNAAIEACEQLGFSTSPSHILASSVDPSVLIDLQMKYVRLLKRRGLFSRAVDVLAQVAHAVPEGTGRKSQSLGITMLLYGIAKTLGSHQNRTDQSSLLCTFCEKRIYQRLRALGVQRRDFLAGRGHEDFNLRGVEALWSKIVDYRIKLQIADAVPETRRRLFEVWDKAIEFEGIEAGRARFARLLAEAKLTDDPQKREAALNQFELLLSQLYRQEPPDLRGIAIRYTQAAEIFLAAGGIDRAGALIEVALKNAERSADWASIARAHLIRSDLCIQSDRSNGRTRWTDAMLALGQADAAVRRHEEPPLPLLLSSCRRQARIALTMGECSLAKRHIKDALDYVATMQTALIAENWTGMHGDSRRPSPRWIEPIARLLTTRERGLMQAKLVFDWDALVSAQTDLAHQLERANQMESNSRIVNVSSARVELIKSSIAHEAANVLSSSISRLLANSTLRIDGEELVRREDIVRTQRNIDEAIRRHITHSQRYSGPAAASGHDWHSIASLCDTGAEAITLLKHFAPNLETPLACDFISDFSVRCDPDLFRVMVMQFLLNSAQEIGYARTGKITLRLSYRVEDDTGLLEVEDSAGQVRQLEAAIAAIQAREPVTVADSGWGLPQALRFFTETWGCRIGTAGEEGVNAILRIGFPPGKRVEKLLT